MIPAREQRASLLPSGEQVKLVIWDLDNTIWDGVLLEDGPAALRPGISELILGLDRLGILQSIASRNDHAMAQVCLERLGIAHYFLVPQISWSIKSMSVEAIARTLNIGLDNVLFIDDQAFELAEVMHAHPKVRTLNAAKTADLLDDPQIRPVVVTEDARRRRMMYMEDEVRRLSEEKFVGSHHEFMITLGMELRIAQASHRDLDRVEELTARTNQLNSTGSTFSRSELNSFIESTTHNLLIVSLKDRFGDYGQIGLALIECSPIGWILKLLLVSCRVLSRGVGTILLNQIAARAMNDGVNLEVEFRETGRNRPMKVALMMAGFRRVAAREDTIILVRGTDAVPPSPTYIELISTW